MAILYNSNYDITVPFSDVCVQFNLATNVEDTFTVPGSATNNYSVRFGYTNNSNVFVCLNATPTIPGSSVVGTQQYNEFRPGDDGSQRFVKGGDVLHFITPDAAGAYMGISLRSLP
jgi:hypothetical protein